MIEAGTKELHYWRDIWSFRELFFFLTWRDIKVRYKQAVLGAFWAVLQPLLTMIIFTVIFSRVAKLETEGAAPYAIMVYCALLPWRLFSDALASSSESLLVNRNMISKIYFPRIIIPLSAIMTKLVEFFISFAVLIALMVYYKFLPSQNIIFLPLFLILCLIISSAVGLGISAMNVQFRDFKYIVPFAIQMGLYISPVGFKSSIVPEKWRFLYSLNPMVGVIDGFRWCILGGTGNFYVPGLVISISMTIITFMISYKIFRSTEKTFADKI